MIMDAAARVVSGTPVSLEQLLAARDGRAARQAAALARFEKPLLSMSVVMPGPVKDGRLPRRVLAAALEAVERVTSGSGRRVLWRDVCWQATGPDALHVVDMDARLLKKAAVELEDRHPLGRLWDLDVIVPGHGQLSRRALGFPARRCLVCRQPAHTCGRSQRHSLDALWTAIRQIVHAHDPRSA